MATGRSGLANGCDYLSLPPRLIMKIRIDPLTGCWLWQGAVSGGDRGAGYGRSNYEGVKWSTHILVRYLIRRRALARHLVHDHECCVRNCCRPGPGHVMGRSHSNNCILREKRIRRMRRDAARANPAVLRLEEDPGQVGVP